MTIAHHIVWLAPIVNLTTKARLKDLEEHGFGIAGLGMLKIRWAPDLVVDELYAIHPPCLLALTKRFAPLLSSRSRPKPRCWKMASYLMPFGLM